MKPKINDGGSAFPVSGRDGESTPFDIPGMTLRDYFAGKAMAAAISTPRLIIHKGEAAIRESTISSAAYSQADAMIKVREQNG